MNTSKFQVRSSGGCSTLRWIAKKSSHLNEPREQVLSTTRWKNANYHREQVLYTTQGTRQKNVGHWLIFLCKVHWQHYQSEHRRKIKAPVALRIVFDHCSTDQEEQKTYFNASLLLWRSDGSFQESICLLHLLCISGAGTSGRAGAAWRVYGSIGWAGRWCWCRPAWRLRARRGGAGTLGEGRHGHSGEEDHNEHESTGHGW
jgi:hypothetical protein